jgi:hypothetical protein
MVENETLRAQTTELPEMKLDLQVNPILALRKEALRFDRRPGVQETPPNEIDIEAEQIFRKLDSQNKKFLTDSDLVKGIKLPNNTTRELEWISALYLLRNQIKDLDTSKDAAVQADSAPAHAISSKDFEQLKNALKTFDSQRYGDLPTEFSANMRLVANSDSYASQRLWGNKNTLDPAAPLQARLGTCYLTASLRALAHTDPSLLRSMISEQPDGKYKVVFPGAKNEPISVDQPSRTELSLINNGKELGTWPAVLIKAFGQYRAENTFRRMAFRTSQYEFDAQSAEAGSAVDALKILTGSSAEEIDLDYHDKKAVGRKLTDLFAEGQKTPVLATSIQHLTGTPERTPDGILKGHVLAITNFNPDGKGGGALTLSDPNDPLESKFEMPLDTAAKNFRSFVYLLPQGEPACTFGSLDKFAIIGTLGIASLLPAVKFGNVIGNTVYRIGFGNFLSSAAQLTSTFAAGLAIPLGIAMGVNHYENACVAVKLNQDYSSRHLQNYLKSDKLIHQKQP